jgi:hypothetical protein
VVVVLLIAGDQLPVIPLVEVVGRAAIAVPEQTAATALNVGVTFVLTVIVVEVEVAHKPVVGVKLYRVVVVLFKTGDHVPVIPFVEVSGKAASVAPEQIGVTAANVGAIFELMVMVLVIVDAHDPAAGVKV